LTIVLYLFKSLHQYHISKLSSTPFMLLFIFLFVVYTVNLHAVWPWSCRVIYYFDTPALGIKHQLFDRVKFLAPLLGKVNYCINYIFYFIVFSFLSFYLTFVSFVLVCFVLFCFSFFFFHFIIFLHVHESLVTYIKW
jgi:hypothetical protein